MNLAFVKKINEKTFVIRFFRPEDEVDLCGHATIGAHFFTLKTLDNKNTAHTRNFAPLYGIEEESATGGANGALSCYLFKYLKNNFNYQNLIFEQGNIMGTPSLVFVELEIKNDNITCVKVGGNAIFDEKLRISLN